MGMTTAFEEFKAKLLNGPALPPPPGVTPDFVDSSNLLHLTIAILTLCNFLATLAVILRMWTKLFIIHQTTLDDCISSSPADFNTLFYWCVSDFILLGWVRTSHTQCYNQLTVIAIRRVGKHFMWNVYQVGLRNPSMEYTAQDLFQNALRMLFYQTCFQLTHKYISGYISRVSFMDQLCFSSNPRFSFNTSGCLCQIEPWTCVCSFPYTQQLGPFLYFIWSWCFSTFLSVGRAKNSGICS